MLVAGEKLLSYRYTQNWFAEQGVYKDMAYLEMTVLSQSFSFTVSSGFVTQLFCGLTQAAEWILGEPSSSNVHSLRTNPLPSSMPSLAWDCKAKGVIYLHSQRQALNILLSKILSFLQGQNKEK